MKKDKNTKNKIIITLLILFILFVAGGTAFLVLKSNAQKLQNNSSSAPAPSKIQGSSTPSSPSSEVLATSTPPAIGNTYSAIPLPDEMRAMWISYLEWMSLDFSTEATMRAQVGPMMENCSLLGLNTVIVAVRPYSDAFYNSNIFPWSDLLTGTQGQAPEYDPLAVLVDEAHKRNLRIEAWLNPYRVRVSNSIPIALAASHPAVLHPEWTVTVGSEIWYNPALPEVQEMVRLGIQEIVENYNVDGINIDDYFYPAFPTPEENTAFDADSFAQYGNSLPLADWRRNNVDTLMKNIYSSIKSTNPSVSFGVSPQGNNENNFNTQYSDVKKWMANEGFADYVMPQIYWGFGYRTKSGSDAAAFVNKTAEWAGYPRNANIKLYSALAPYRIGTLAADGTRTGLGDGGFGEQAEWESGHNIADMVAHLRTVPGFTGFSLFRYGFMFPAASDALAASEVNALAALLR